MKIQNTFSVLAPIVLFASYFSQPEIIQDGSSPGEIVLMKTGECFHAEAGGLADGGDSEGEQSVATTELKLCGTALMHAGEEWGLGGFLRMPDTDDSQFESSFALEERAAQIVRILELMEPDPANVPLDRRIELIEMVIAHISLK